jgi:heat shock protein HslJ/chitodextrinase
MGDVDNPTAPAEDADFTAFFTRQTGVPSGLLQGRSGCNQYNATFIASVTEIKIDPPATTMMACPSPVAEQETEYLQALAGASQYAIIGDVLKIPYGEGKMLSFVAMPVEAVPEVDLRPLQGTFWFLTAINGQALISGTQITAQFFVNPDAVSGSVSGSAGCNNYTAGISAGFQVGAAATTRVSCATPDGVMQQEQFYLSQLQLATGYSLAGGQLILPTTSGTLVYSSTPPEDQPEPVEPNSLLVNRKWYLKAIEDTEAVPGSEPTAYFSSDGHLSGYTGCNSYNGRFTTDGDEISISNLSSSVSSCPEAQMEQEAAFLSGMSKAETFEVSDTKLRIYTNDNEALFFQSTPPEPVEPEDDDDNVDPPVDPIPPQAVIEAPREAKVNQEVAFSGAGSQSAVEITSYQWNFADGTEVEGANVTHAYTNPGDYLVALTVTDANKLSNTTTWVISILEQEEPEPPDPPSAVIIAPPTADTLTPVIFNGSASLSDASITSYQWDMGDGTLLEGAQVEYTFTTAGTYTVKLTVTDEFGQQGSTECDITVFETVPVPSDSTQPEATPTP